MCLLFPSLSRVLGLWYPPLNWVVLGLRLTQGALIRMWSQVKHFTHNFQFQHNYVLKKQRHDTNADIKMKPKQLLISSNKFHSVLSTDTCAIMVYKSLVKIRLLTVIRHLKHWARTKIRVPKWPPDKFLQILFGVQCDPSNFAFVNFSKREPRSDFIITYFWLYDDLSDDLCVKHKWICDRNDRQRILNKTVKTACWLFN